MSRVIALVDLDDTLFQTRRKCPPHFSDEALTPLGFARDGSALSFATPQQMSFLDWLAETAHLVPVTARSLDAFRRVRLRHTGAICAHGGLILDEAGRPDADWHSSMAAHAHGHAPALNALSAAIAERASAAREPIAVRVLAEAELPLYVLAKHVGADAEALHALVDAAVPDLPPGWTRHSNGNNVALLPPFLGKQHAVGHLLPPLRARFPDAAVIGIGDSRTDAPFMALCDFAMLPTGSQLAERLFDGC
jgi:hypothetical protein